jgi:hypothetical protein
MPDAGGTTGAVYIEAPRDPRLKALYQHWEQLRQGRVMPARADFDPSAIPALLPHVLMYGVNPDGGYTIRLVGEEVVQFAGRNAAGGPAGHTMPPNSTQTLLGILDAVAGERAPKFRAGKAHWHPAKNHRDFEACFLPLSGGGESVNFVLGGVAFPDAPV